MKNTINYKKIKVNHRNRNKSIECIHPLLKRKNLTKKFLEKPKTHWYRFHKIVCYVWYMLIVSCMFRNELICHTNNDI